MSRQSIQKIKAMLLCIEYGILFVDTVDTKIKASNAFNAMFVDTVDTGVCGSYTTPYALRANWSNRLKIWGMSTLSIHACWKSPSRVDVGKDQRVNQVRLANYANELSGKWLEILIESSCQKLVCEKSKFCKIQGMSILSIHAACCMQRDKEPS